MITPIDHKLLFCVGRPALAYGLQGELNEYLLERCIGELVDRHEVLRTRFVEQRGEAEQRITDSGAFHLERIDLRSVPMADRQAALQQHLTTACRQPFDLEQGSLLRVTLLTVSAEEHILLLLVHHLVFDGWSEGVFFRELAALYAAYQAGQPSPLPPLPFQYADFAAWQQQSTSDLEVERSYWKSRLAGVPGLLELPTDYPRPPHLTNVGRTLFRSLPKSLSEELKHFSRQQETTLFVTLLAAWKVLLHRYTGQDDLVVGTAVADRYRQDLEPLIGLFANTVALRTDLSGNPSFSELLKRIQKVLHGALDHSRLPFEEMVRELNVERHPNCAPLVQVVFVLHSVTIELPGLEVERLPIDPTAAKFDITLLAVEQPKGLDLWLEYNTDLFDPETIERMADHYTTILQAVLNNPQCDFQYLPHVDASKRIRNSQASGEHLPQVALHPDPCINDLRSLAAIWKSLLKVNEVSVQDDFFHLGGHSLLVLKLAASIESEFGKVVSIAQLFEHRTLADQVHLLSNMSVAGELSQLITIRGGSQPPMILLPNLDGSPFGGQWAVKYLSQDLPLLAIDAGKFSQPEAAHSPVTIESLAEKCVQQIQQCNLNEPYQFLGYSFGGFLAYEVARQLANRGKRIRFLGIIDAGIHHRSFSRLSTFFRDIGYFAANAPLCLTEKVRDKSLWPGILQRLDSLARRLKLQPSQIKDRHVLPTGSFPNNQVPWFLRGKSNQETLTQWLHYQACCSYSPGEYAGTVTLFRARARPLFHDFSPDAGWSPVRIGKLDVRIVPGNHITMVEEPHCQVLAREIQSTLQQSNLLSQSDYATSMLK